GRIRARLADLSRRLGDADWLDGGFSAGDLLTVDVLRRVDPALLAGTPNLAAYVARGEARPAFRRAFAAQRAFFQDSAAQCPAGRVSPPPRRRGPDRSPRRRPAPRPAAQATADTASIGRSRRG